MSFKKCHTETKSVLIIQRRITTGDDKVSLFRHDKHDNLKGLRLFYDESKNSFNLGNANANTNLFPHFNFCGKDYYVKWCPN